MPKKQDLIVALTAQLQELFADPVGNYDALSAVFNQRRDALIQIRDMAQQELEWLTALGFALQRNKIKGLIEKNGGTK